jgi:hypothetical protein
MLTALPRLFEGDPDAGPSLVEAGEIAERLADADAPMFARLGRGYSLILQGRVAEGMALLDEVMISVTADEMAPMLAGIAYCQLITLCQAVFDLRRAREWTQALTRWCDAQPDIVPFRGNCLVHRCEIFWSFTRLDTRVRTAISGRPEDGLAMWATSRGAGLERAGARTRRLPIPLSGGVRPVVRFHCPRGQAAGGVAAVHPGLCP